MAIDRDIQNFVRAIGAIDPNDATWRQIFKRSNYFILGDLFLIVKISRSSKPFWGLSKKLLEYFLDAEYCVVLLTSAREGYFFTKNEVENYIDKKWPYREADDNYKINYYSLSSENSFSTPEKFLEKLRKKVGKQA